jgi:two-component system chemotaxis response regulator CheY
MAKTILIVDDSVSLRMVVKVALVGAGYEVVEAQNGEDALAKLAAHSKIHLIISDVNMPIMDGITFVREVKKQPAYKFTPIIMLTTEALEDMKKKGQEAGAKAWMVKPFKPEQMLAAVSKLVLP